MILIGLTGTLGAGKGTVTEYLVREKGFTHFSVSGFLKEEALRRGLMPSREVYHDIANEYRKTGATGLINAVYASIPVGTQKAIVESLHAVGEVQHVQKLGGRVLGVDADIHKRYERIAARGSEKDDVSFEEFRAMEERESQSDDENEQNLKASLAAADTVLTNNGTPDDLHAAVDAACTELGINQ